MARRFTKPIDLYHAQRARFERNLRDVRSMHYELAEHGRADAFELTGGSPMGKERIRQLKRLWHPFGRGANARESTPTGARRGGAKVRNRLRALPVAVVSGRLRRSFRLARVSRGRGIQRFDLGPDKSAGRSAFVLSPSGTRKMVARGYWEQVKRRWRARNKALLDVLKQRQAR